MAAVKLQVYKLFEKTYGEENAKIIMAFIEENNEKQINHLKSIFLTKEDKIDILNQMKGELIDRQNSMYGALVDNQNSMQTALIERQNKMYTDLLDRHADLLKRLDSHFKWLVGIMLSLFGLSIALAKLKH